ncbi:alpha/beta fold hydrolase [Silicimonas algicola]|uniref:Pimeloyl-ACP methyl ester carboxylesterase n=1 Tax=Silicimonas algicola TaxID=1826607 RepID=A0A316GMN0_9RHOB|nr:alpha/beta fold hydrolase [Silicimonas algicola]AZQ68765.1 alpha/beta fold hydrolase [Silicimonas algicola]PWK56157.1 pimeloyl-ACP methyl ester carboxylesterase [Silicimonas algicola]
MLSTVIHGTDTGAPPLLIAHGLFGSARNWGVIAKRLSERRQVTAVDMRNHADSPWRDAHGYAEMADDMAQVIDGAWDVLGHSMGGKAAMVLALTHPEKVRRLVVADIAPVAYGHSQSHLIEAMRALDLGAVTSRREADEALKDAIAEPGTRAFLLQSLDVGEKRWRLNLDVLDREMERITGFPDMGEREFGEPVLFLSGDDSSYVQREHRALILKHFPKARFARIPGAGHWLHADKPREFEAAVETFLSA